MWLLRRESKSGSVKEDERVKPMSSVVECLRGDALTFATGTGMEGICKADCFPKPIINFVFPQKEQKAKEL